MSKKIKLTVDNTDTEKEALYLLNKNYTVVKLKNVIDILGNKYFRLTDLTDILNLKVEGKGESINIITAETEENNKDETKDEENQEKNNNSLEGKRIVLDPGHHEGVNISPVDKSYSEGNYVLKVALHLEKLLKENGAQVFLTRNDGNAISLSDRGEKHKDKKPHVFISIHTNAMGSKVQTQARGTEIIYSVKHPKDEEIAKVMMEKIADILGVETRRVFNRLSSNSTDNNPIDWYGVIRSSVTEFTHSFLIEGAFHDNPNDLSILTENEGYKTYAKGIFEALIKYFNS
ncbi:MAG: N-acetylmuramoyl-L-alanine amidase [Eubacteriales bacterium]